MKKSIIAAFLFMSVASAPAFAKAKVDTVKVLGNCESCKARIEKAAKTAGANKANWNNETQILEVSYDDANTSLMKIEKQIAFVGHDTRDVKASDNAYKGLHSCCQYDRTGAAGAKVCDDSDEKQKQ